MIKVKISEVNRHFYKALENDIDFDRKLIRVNKSLNHGKVEETKTKKSIRNVCVPENLITVLKE